MPKRASDEAVDPVRSRLAGAVAAPMPKVGAQPAEETERLPDPAPTPKRVQPARPIARAKPPSPVKAPDLLANVNRKFMVTPQEAERMADVTLAISKAFGGKVAHTKISRVLWTILGDAEERIRRMPPSESRALPSTGNAEAQAEYEQALYEFVQQILHPTSSR